MYLQGRSQRENHRVIFRGQINDLYKQISMKFFNHFYVHFLKFIINENT